jgi:alkylation response protein AidB-like acyl-CoA dehydrogenase
MNFQMTDEQRIAVDSLRQFLDKEIEPEFIAHGEGFIPKEKMRKWQMALTPFGLINAPFPEKWGGVGLDWETHLLLFEEVAVTSMDIAIPLVLNAVCADMLVQHASEKIKQKYLPGLLAGELFLAMGISEPNVGSDVAAVSTKAVRDGDHWVINGEKTWITNGVYADAFICTCKTGEGELTHILVPNDTPGYETRDIQKMALNGQSTAQIFLTDVRVPVENVIGSIGSGLKNTLVVFERARCHMAAWGYSIARRAMQEAIKYSQDRVQHGKPIAGHQLVAEKLATMATEIDAARLLTLRAVSMIDAGIRCDTECSMAKWYATEIAVIATRNALQIHGGNGVTKEFIVERLVRESIIAPIPDGTTEIQKLLISRNLTGIQAFR